MNFLATIYAPPDETAYYKLALEKPMSALALGITLALMLLVFFRARHIAIAAIVAAVCYLPQTETLNLGFHFYALRLVLLAGIIRVFAQGKNKGMQWGKIDRALLIYTGIIFFVAILRAPSELTFRLGGLYDILLGYFTLRGLLKDEADFQKTLATIAYVILPFAALMIYETVTNHNCFSLFNGVAPDSWIRGEHTRAQGPFRNPITAGAFGATFTMLYASLFFSGIRRGFVLLGFLASAAIMLSAHSSGPFLGLALGLVAFLTWPFHCRLKAILWSLVAFLIVLQVAMKAPIWFLIAKISSVTGGGGYHRAKLIEQAVHYFNRWWLAGTTDTADWFPYQINGKADITNWFIAAGVDAGVLGLLAALGLVVALFKMLGTGITANPEKGVKKLLWGLGATLVGSLGILISVTYADQMQIVFYFLLASIAALAARRPAPVFVPELSVLPPARKRERVEWREKILHI